MANWKAQSIHLLHFACILFLVFGFLLPEKGLYFHIICIPLVILQWHLNKGECILTQWEHKLSIEPKEESPGEGQFIKSLFRKVGVELSDMGALFVAYGFLIVSGIISVARLI